MGRYRPTGCRRLRAGFTLVEALVALTIAGIAASALLLGVTSALHTTDETLQQTIAQGLAQQLMDEVVGACYADRQPSSSRALCDSIDDFNGLRAQPPTDAWGVALGTEDQEGTQRDPQFRIPSGYLNRWRQEVDVYYVSPTDLTTRISSTKVEDYLAVEVRIVYVDPERGDRVLSKLRRVVAYVKPIP
jgi:prepilin-type N-terminal cleavage/methylation domain-containing protein